MLSDKLTAARIREQGEMKVVKVIDPPGPAVPAGNEKRMLALAVAFAAASGPRRRGADRRRVAAPEDRERGRRASSRPDCPSWLSSRRIRTGRPVFMNGIPDTTGRGPSDQLMFTEAFRALRVAIELSTRGEPLKRLLVTSAFADEGKSTVVANLGYRAQRGGAPGGARRHRFSPPHLAPSDEDQEQQGPGGDPRVRDSVGADARPGQHRAYGSPSAGSRSNPRSRGMLAGSKLRELIGEMTNRADFVICDSSPVLLIPDNLLLASAVDGVVLVAKAGVDGVPRPGANQGACSRAPAPGYWAWC